MKPPRLICRPPSLTSDLTYLVRYVTPVPTALTGDNSVTADRDDDGQFHFTKKDTDGGKLQRHRAARLAGHGYLGGTNTASQDQEPDTSVSTSVTTENGARRNLQNLRGRH